MIRRGRAGGLLCATLLALPAAAADLRVRVLDAAGQPLRDVVVLAEGGPVPAAAPARVVVDQVDRRFVPHVTVVRTGTEIVFPNSDDVSHQVYSFSPAKRFQLPLYRGKPYPPVLFDTPGIVTLGCNIHDQMLAYVYVTDAPAFAKTGADGVATLAGLGAGQWRLQLWTPRLRRGQDGPVTTVALGAADAAVDIRLPGRLRPEFRSGPGAWQEY